MIIFKQNNDLIEKYKVSFDKEEIAKLREEIINNCSFIEHKEYESDYQPSFANTIVKNFKSIPVGVKEYFEGTEFIHKYIYDIYNPPYLVALIDSLLNNSQDAVNDILYYDISKQMSPIEAINNKINSVNKEFINIEPENIYKRKSKLNELEELFKMKEKNKNQQSIDTYYNELIDLINLELVDTLSIEELNRVENFLEEKISQVKTSDYILNKKI